MRRHEMIGNNFFQCNVSSIHLSRRSSTAKEERITRRSLISAFGSKPPVIPEVKTVASVRQQRLVKICCLTPIPNSPIPPNSIPDGTCRLVSTRPSIPRAWLQRSFTLSLATPANVKPPMMLDEPFGTFLAKDPTRDCPTARWITRVSPSSNVSRGLATFDQMK
jgi:hypothetical protein